MTLAKGIARQWPKIICQFPFCVLHVVPISQCVSCNYTAKQSWQSSQCSYTRRGSFLSNSHFYIMIWPCFISGFNPTVLLGIPAGQLWSLEVLPIILKLSAILAMSRISSSLSSWYYKNCLYFTTILLAIFSSIWGIVFREILYSICSLLLLTHKCDKFQLGVMRHYSRYHKGDKY